MSGLGFRIKEHIQTFQNLLIKEYTLNYSRIHNMIKAYSSITVFWKVWEHLKL